MELFLQPVSRLAVQGAVLQGAEPGEVEKLPCPPLRQAVQVGPEVQLHRQHLRSKDPPEVLVFRQGPGGSRVHLPQSGQQPLKFLHVPRGITGGLDPGDKGREGVHLKAIGAHPPGLSHRQCGPRPAKGVADHAVPVQAALVQEPLHQHRGKALLVVEPAVPGKTGAVGKVAFYVGICRAVKVAVNDPVPAIQLPVKAGQFLKVHDSAPILLFLWQGAPISPGMPRPGLGQGAAPGSPAAPPAPPGHTPPGIPPGPGHFSRSPPPPLPCRFWRGPRR